ncbi:hypothetical protein SmJEL517_g04436 [Synchytrium microbalum]|uniref:CBS domain-containing protein n=1 Tax=Synchytrium microbalum TaxID=1806994 RepID=A0A507BTZ3_9FUNG|nr:uncharacterized protein SmJEL517_g04436 [Synchytrium microbalum]TPX32437.1 hypothetical protein SmJEL517_g04436 [Synchytrium microbalum]
MSLSEIDEVEVHSVGSPHLSLSRHSSDGNVSSSHSVFPASTPTDEISHGDWRYIPVKEVMEKREVVTVDAQDRAEVAFNLLVSSNISSIPIYEDKTSNLVGILDYGDVLQFMLSELEAVTKPEKNITVSELLRRSRQSAAHLSLSPSSSSISSADPRTSIVSVESLDQRREKPLYTFSPDAPLKDVLELFGRGVHRAVVQGGDRVGIVSQSTVIRWIFSHSKFYPELTKLITSTVKELGLGTQNVLTVGSEVPVIDALKMMVKLSVSSLGIVDKTGVLLSNLSLADVKWAIQSPSPQFLYDSVMHFRGQVDQQSGIQDGRDSAPVFDITESTTLGYAMSKVIATKTHRVWVTESHRPKTVISLTDMIKLVASLESATD